MSLRVESFILWFISYIKCLRISLATRVKNEEWRRMKTMIQVCCSLLISHLKALVKEIQAGILHVGHADEVLILYKMCSYNYFFCEYFKKKRPVDGINLNKNLYRLYKIYKINCKFPPVFGITQYKYVSFQS